MKIITQQSGDTFLSAAHVCVFAERVCDVSALRVHMCVCVHVQWDSCVCVLLEV